VIANPEEISNENQERVGGHWDTVRVDGGFYLSPELGISHVSMKGGSHASVTGLRLEYEYFLSGDIAHGLWCSLFMEFW
jgi:hypothetical protein